MDTRESYRRNNCFIEFPKRYKHEIGVSIPLDTNKISKGRIFGDDRHSMYCLLGIPPCLPACKYHPGVML